MSIYQNNYFIVPIESKYKLFEGINLSSFLDEGFFDDELLWEENSFNYKDVESYLLKNKFEAGESWSKNLKIFGHIDFNCIKIFIEENKIISISFRINYSIEFFSFLKKVVDFCAFFNFLVVDNELNVLGVDYDVVKNSVLSSKEYKNYINYFNDKNN